MGAKPQLVVTDMVGYHNQNLPETITRLTRGGSWKHQRIVVILPSADLVPVKCALSWWNMAFPPNNGVVKMVCLGQEVGEAYSNTIEQVLAHPDLSKWEYILTIEHDNIIPSDAAIRLTELMEEHPEFAAISGGYFCKGTGGCFQAWGDISDPLPNFRPVPPRTDGQLLETYGLGMGCCIFRLSMFKDERIEKPWFRTKKGHAGEGMGTQDLVFWGNARKWGYRCAVACDIKVGHHDASGTFGIEDFTW